MAREVLALRPEAILIVTGITSSISVTRLADAMVEALKPVVDLPDAQQPTIVARMAGPDEEVLALHDALEQLAARDRLKARLVELRFFGGLTLAEAAECLGVSLATADRAWRYARAWLYAALAGDDPEQT